MSDRDKKLKRLEYEKAAKEMQVTISGTALLDTMDKVEELKEALGVGIDLNNIDELVTQLKEVQSLTPEVKKLEEAIKNISIPEMPESVTIKGLDSLVEATKIISKKKDIVLEPITEKSFVSVTERLDTLIEKVQSAKVSEPSQDAEKFIPVRRVIKAGNVFIYDDFVPGGAGGGGSSSGGGGAVTQGTTPWVVAGDVANDSVDSGSPLKVGGVAATSLPTAVANGDRVNATFSKTGAQIVHSALREQLGHQQTTITSNTGETTIVTANATYFQDLYGLIITNTSATVCKVTIKDATAGTTRVVLQVPATETRGFTFPADSGIKQAVVNNNWTATCGTSVSAIEITAMVNLR